ncbi:MAG TPA: hypothetical protein VGA56_13720, partial [Opitutaceae bacterium]
MKQRPRHVLSREKQGFALVLSVVLLALVILVLVMLTALARVETSIAGNTRKFSQTRQNALLGMERAIAKLQATFGPDQRVSAAADLLPTANVDKRNWTGVWDTTNLGAGPVWLVSGQFPDHSTPISGVSDNWVELVGTNTTNASGRVSAEKENLVGEAPDGT